MERAEFEGMVVRMEALAAQRPSAYRRRVFALAALGYCYLVFVVIVLCVLGLLAVASVVYLKGLGVKLVIVIGALLYGVLRSLWVKQEPPQGEVVGRQQAPQLFAMLGDLERRLETPRIDVVLVTPDVNAGIAQVPRLGLFGWHRNFLVLGLPLMKGLTVEQFRSVLAHELGHLSRGHARAGNWIYRLRTIWARLESTFEHKPRWGSGLIRRFFRWYISYFNAVSFPFARANEYEADAASVQTTSARHAAQALTGVHIISSYLSNCYWPAIHASAKDSPEPSFAPYSHFVAESIREVPQSDLDRWREAAVSEVTSHADTHPSLGDRLRKMQQAAEFAPPAPGDSADRLLGEALTQLESGFDSRWKSHIAESWRKFHAETQDKRVRLASLRATADTPDLTEAAALELASLEEEVGTGPGAAAVLLKATFERFEDSLPVRFAWARRELCDGVEAGALRMTELIARQPAYLLAGSQLLRDFHARRGEHEMAQAWQRRHFEEAMRQQRSHQERQRLLLSDRYMPHGIDAATLQNLKSQLMGIGDLAHAYLVRKLTVEDPERPLLVLGIKTARWWQLRDAARTQRVVNAISQTVTFPHQTFIMGVEGRMYKFARKFRGVRSARIL